MSTFDLITSLLQVASVAGIFAWVVVLQTNADKLCERVKKLEEKQP